MISKIILTKSQAKIPSEHFDFCEWQAAFIHYDKMIDAHGVSKVQFVCSQHPHTSGYWIEPAGCECSLGDDLIPANKILELRKKIEHEINTAQIEYRTPKFVTL